MPVPGWVASCIYGCASNPQPTPYQMTPYQPPPVQAPAPTMRERLLMGAYERLDNFLQKGRRQVDWSAGSVEADILRRNRTQPPPSPPNPMAQQALREMLAQPAPRPAAGTTQPGNSQQGINPFTLPPDQALRPPPSNAPSTATRPGRSDRTMIRSERNTASGILCVMNRIDLLACNQMR